MNTQYFVEGNTHYLKSNQSLGATLLKPASEGEGEGEGRECRSQWHSAAILCSDNFTKWRHWISSTLIWILKTHMRTPNTEGGQQGQEIR